MYRPPRDRNENYQSFINEIDPVLTTSGNFKCEIILTGDLNINLLNVNVKPFFNEFLDIITSHSFYPHIILPTRLSRRSGTLIDNFFCKFTSSLSDVSSCIFTSGISDHFPYCISINVTRAIIDPIKYIYVNNHSNKALNHFKIEITSACLVEQIDSDPNLDPNHNYNIKERKLTVAKQKHLQCKKVKFNKHKHKKSLWITKAIVRSIKRRDFLYRKLKETPSDSIEYEHRKINVRTYNIILRRSIFIAKNNFYHSQFQKYIFNIKSTWSVIRNILNKNKSKSSLPDEMKINNCLIKDKETTAHSFNKYFANIGSTLASGLKDVPDNSHMNYLNDPVSTFFSFQNVDEETVSKLIDNINCKNSSGIDELSTILIKLVKSGLLKSLTTIINQSLHTGIFPDKLKIAKVIPLFKKGDPTLIENYRPISLLPAISKKFERVIFNQ